MLEERLGMRRSHIGILGGTGALGGGLAVRFAAAGHQVTIGSRMQDKAKTAAAALSAAAGATIAAADNKHAAAAVDVAILAVPYAAQRATVEEASEQLAGKILIDATVPLVPPRISRVQLPATGSAVVAIQQLLGERVRVVSAFQNVSAQHLKNIGHPIDCDVLVCGDDEAAREVVIDLARDIGLRGLHGGPLCNSAAAEALTSVLIAINRRYKIPGSGIRITGLGDAK